MTGSGIVLNSCGMPGKSADYRKRLLSEIRERAAPEGLKLEVAAGDMCCEEKGTWNDSVGVLAKTAETIEAEATGRLSFEDYNHEPTTSVLTTRDQVKAAVGWIYEELDKRPVGEKTLGFDIENTPRIVADSKPPYARTDTIQLAMAAHNGTKGRSWVIHCRGWATRKQALPKSLHQLLQDPAVSKVGLCISRDATMLGKVESFPMTKVEPIEDCGKMAKKAAITPNARLKVTRPPPPQPCPATPPPPSTRMALPLCAPHPPARARTLSPLSKAFGVSRDAAARPGSREDGRQGPPGVELERP